MVFTFTPWQIESLQSIPHLTSCHFLTASSMPTIIHGVWSANELAGFVPRNQPVTHENNTLLLCRHLLLKSPRKDLLLLHLPSETEETQVCFHNESRFWIAFGTVVWLDDISETSRANPRGVRGLPFGPRLFYDQSQIWGYPNSWMLHHWYLRKSHGWFGDTHGYLLWIGIGNLHLVLSVCQPFHADDASYGTLGDDSWDNHQSSRLETYCLVDLPIEVRLSKFSPRAGIVGAWDHHKNSTGYAGMIDD